MSSRIEQVEGLLIEELNKEPLNTYCKHFEPYDGRFTVEDILNYEGLLPVCFVSFIRDRFKEVTTGITYVDVMDLSVIVIAENLRGNFEAKKGPEGVSQMLEDVKNLLHLNTLGGMVPTGMVLKERFPHRVTPTLAAFELVFEARLYE